MFQFFSAKAPGDREWDNLVQEKASCHNNNVANQKLRYANIEPKLLLDLKEAPAQLQEKEQLGARKNDPSQWKSNGVYDFYPTSFLFYFIF